MAAGFILAKAPDADRLEKGDRRQKLDELPALRRFHLGFVVSAECLEIDLAVLIFRNEIGAGGEQGQPEIEVIAALPVFAPNPARNLARDAQAKALARLPRGAVAISGHEGFHARTVPKQPTLYRKTIRIKLTMVPERAGC